MRIVLVSPYPDITAIGIRTLSSCLKVAGHNVDILFLPQDFRRNYEASALLRAAEFASGADLVGVTVMTNFFDNACQITRAFKNMLNVPVVFGGSIPQYDLKSAWSMRTLSV